ncbi:MAG: 1-acyl-sn-glycerol-3-phosphate acyltransferase [Myxococcota bacterium]
MSDLPPGAALPRRLKTISVYFAVAALYLGLAPLVGTLLLVVDLFRRRRFALTRAWAFMGAHLTAEVVGVVVLGAFWLLTGFGRSRARLRVWTYAMQTAWVRAQWRAATLIFGWRWRVRGLESVAPGPIVVLVRHTSLVDTVVPTTFISGAAGISLRFVLKKELLNDPCLDIAGHWLPNVFVDRKAQDSTAALASIRELATDLDVDEGALIYPEGTLFSPAKLQRALEKLSEHAPPLYEQARALRHTLLPRPGGTLAILEGAPDADVVLCAHEGLGGVGKINDLLSGALVGRTVHVEFRRFARSTVPSGADARTEWLMERWLELDRWVASQRTGVSR